MAKITSRSLATLGSNCAANLLSLLARKMLAVAISSFPSWPIRAKLRMDGETLLLCDDEGSQDQEVSGSGGVLLLFLSTSLLAGEESKDHGGRSFCEPLDSVLICPIEIYEERYMVGIVKPDRTKSMNIVLGITLSEYFGCL